MSITTETTDAAWHAMLRIAAVLHNEGAEAACNVADTFGEDLDPTPETAKLLTRTAAMLDNAARLEGDETLRMLGLRVRNRAYLLA